MSHQPDHDNHRPSTRGRKISYLRTSLLLLVNSVVVIALMVAAFMWLGKPENVPQSEAATNSVINGVTMSQSFASQEADPQNPTFYVRARINFTVRNTSSNAVPNVYVSNNMLSPQAAWYVSFIKPTIIDFNITGPSTSKNLYFNGYSETMMNDRTDASLGASGSSSDTMSGYFVVRLRRSTETNYALKNAMTLNAGGGEVTDVLSFQAGDIQQPFPPTATPTTRPTATPLPPTITPDPNFTPTVKLSHLRPVSNPSDWNLQKQRKAYWDTGVTGAIGLDVRVSNVKLYSEVNGVKTYYPLRCYATILYTPSSDPRYLRCDHPDSGGSVSGVYKLSGPGMTKFNAEATYNGQVFTIPLSYWDMIDRPAPAPNCGYYRPGFPKPCPTNTPTPAVKMVNGVSIVQRHTSTVADLQNPSGMVNVRIDFTAKNTLATSVSQVYITNSLNALPSSWLSNFTGATIVDYNVSGPSVTKNPTYNGDTDIRINDSTQATLGASGSGSDTMTGYFVVKLRRSSEANYSLRNAITLNAGGGAVTDTLNFQTGL